MKTAISIPQDVFKQGEALAKKLGISRSQMYVQALKSLVAACGHVHVREALDKIYASEESKLEPGLGKAQSRALGGEKW